METTTDKVLETKDEVKTISAPTPEAKEPAPTYTKAQLDKAIEDALKREGGRVNKTMEQRLMDLEAETKKYKDQLLVSTATKYGIPEDKIKELGTDNPETIERIASYLKPQASSQPKFRVDSGVTTGNLISVDQLREKYAQGQISRTQYEKGMKDSGFSP